MLNSRKKICASRNKKYKYSNYHAVRKIISERKKNHKQVKWSVPKYEPNIVFMQKS